MHGKRAIIEPARLLSAHEVVERVCAHFGCNYEPFLPITETLSDSALGEIWLHCQPRAALQELPVPKPPSIRLAGGGC
jgi:hypothetical protein